MCVNFKPVSRSMLAEVFCSPIQTSLEWKLETWQDYLAPIIKAENGHRLSALAAFSMVPKAHMPEGVKRYSTMNARAETIGQLRSYAKYWREARLCLVPMTAFFEPCYESGKAERWKISMVDDSPFAVAGIYRSWPEADGSTSFSFSQITINADDHPLMKRFHKPGDEKRSLVIVPPNAYDDWLNCRNPEIARSFLTLFPAEHMAVQRATKE